MKGGRGVFNVRNDLSPCQSVQEVENRTVEATQELTDSEELKNVRPFALSRPGVEPTVALLSLDHQRLNH